ncbi:MAG: hypothetical protein DWQ09_15460 [Proteobacteria bacterium]|nr:MAG: hypothetical protein DWQ09_15460 [Pseudomonadota bacterium]QKK12391.1 MAG: hypothetical protein HND59_13205 [Pseudomonadota bacterium]
MQHTTYAAHYRGLILILVAGLMLSACSATRIAYQNADNLIAGYAEKHLDLGNEQSQLLRDRLAAWLVWHRTEQVPGMREQLDAIHRQLADGLTAQEAEAVIQAIRHGLKSVIAGLLPASAELYSSLSTSQLAELEAAFKENNEEYREDLLNDSLEARQEKRLRWFVKQAERWVGDLSDAQTNWLELQLLRYPSTAEEWLEYRIAQQQRLLGLLRRHSGAAQIEKFLLEWTVERQGLTPSLAKSRQEMLNDAPRLLLEFDGSLSPRQREHWLERLTFYLGMADKMILPRGENSAPAQN